MISMRAHKIYGLHSRNLRTDVECKTKTRLLQDNKFKSAMVAEYGHAGLLIAQIANVRKDMRSLG